MTTGDELKPRYLRHVDRLRREYGVAAERHGFDALVISAGAPAVKSRFDDQAWPLRPTPAFAHWVPLRDPGSALAVVPGDRPVLVRAIESSFWEGAPRADADHIWDAFAVREVGPDAVRAELPHSPRLAFIGDDDDRARAWGVDDAAINPPALVADLDRVRAVKSDYERACMREANRRAAAGHLRLRDAFAGGDLSELALHLRYLEATGQDDPDTPYKNIVALGENASTLHHIDYGREAPGGKDGSLLVDAGATYLGYASDITRTWVKGSGEAARTFAELVGRVEDLQQTLCAEIAPGAAYEDLHERAHELLAGVLCDLELARARPDELVASGATRHLFPHGLGHSIGVQVHDVGLRPRDPRPENPFLRNTSDIAAGHVFTIEPGCYFIDSLLAELRGGPAGGVLDWKAVDALRPFGGVRIEDDVAVTDAGPDNLTRSVWPA